MLHWYKKNTQFLINYMYGKRGREGWFKLYNIRQACWGTAGGNEMRTVQSHRSLPKKAKLDHSLFLGELEGNIKSQIEKSEEGFRKYK